jgi:hypothetical protein
MVIGKEYDHDAIGFPREIRLWRFDVPVVWREACWNLESRH